MELRGNLKGEPQGDITKSLNKLLNVTLIFFILSPFPQHNLRGILLVILFKNTVPKFTLNLTLTALRIFIHRSTENMFGKIYGVALNEVFNDFNALSNSR